MSMVDEVTIRYRMLFAVQKNVDFESISEKFVISKKMSMVDELTIKVYEYKAIKATIQLANLVFP